MITKAVYAGSFDPITNGHLWMVRQGAQLFDDLVVAVGSNPDKRYTFTNEERLRMLEEAVRDLNHITVDGFESQFLVLPQRFPESLCTGIDFHPHCIYFRCNYKK